MLGKDSHFPVVPGLMSTLLTSVPVGNQKMKCNRAG
jgi:hypothetical protein